MLYMVVWDYRSGQVVLKAGETVELDDQLATWVTLDSPGVIVPVPPAMERAPEAPEHDRMVKRARKR